MATSSPSPLARLHALWTLEGLDALDDSSIAAALRDATAGVRENAVRLAEPRLRSSSALSSQLVGMTDDPDARVRFLVLGALGWIDTPEAAAAHSRLLFAEIDDVWMQRAGLSAGSDQAAALFEAAVRPGSEVLARYSEGRVAFIRQLASILGARQKPEEIHRTIGSVLAEASTTGRSDAAAGDLDSGDEWWRAAALEGLAQGARDRRSAAATLSRSRDALVTLQRDDNAGVRAGALDLLRLCGAGQGPAWEEAVRRAVALADRQDAEPSRRADAIAFAALDHPERRAKWFASFASPHEPEAVQAAGVLALGRIDPKLLGRPRGKVAAPADNSSGQTRIASSDDIGRFLLTRWPALTPEVRSHAADVLLGDAARARLLVAAMRDGRIQPWTLGFWQKQSLVLHRDPEIRKAARAVLEEDPRQRGATVKRYAAALDLEGHADRGERVFSRVCAACHRLDGKGGDLGPDLATVRHRPPLTLLSDILLPSQSIAQHYETYVVERTDGRTEAGVLSAETPAAITLRQGGGREVVIRRTDIRKMSVSPRSTMPSDLDKVISPDEMADLLAYVRGR
jgi:putative heme-binding domain-containing protein